ncbi:Cof-type HAD-IIB family hydrolase [Inconstantimicrobium mannanitabidum]|uniref:Haloacid dehalogenase n=1 Tax=Inconstantimicrobium mannanitabidum TaxID=1604901 RepID=A0ACB5RAR0_9CLOT|nr:HAD family hydrolase [Clostridium sp. TW13]GKX66088.1 haloacid dehalogenase [Clostridium sp. TW13]
MIKLIATDMDGTLLNSNHEINPEFDEVFNKLKEKNILFAVASGRQYYTLLKQFDKVKKDMLFIAENGTFVVHKDKELVVNDMDREQALHIIRIAREISQCEIVLCGKDSAYIESQNQSFAEEVNRYYVRCQCVEKFEDVDDKILKVAICDLKGTENNSLNYFQEYQKSVQITVSGKLWLDITAKGINKGIAIKEIQQALNVSYDETMVFGDYLNDLEMMQSAYYSYAMENAHEELKKVSRFTAKSNDENGVLDTIKQIVLS